MAGAGTSQKPDILDARGDITLRMGGPSLNVAAPAIDILAAWAESGEDSFSLGLRVADLSDRPPGFDGAAYAFTFRTENHSFAAARAFHDRGTWWFLLYAQGNDGSVVDVALEGQVDFAQSIIVMHVPHGLVDSPLQNVIVSTLLARTAGGSWSGGGYAWFRDSAPDNGDGPTLDPRAR